MIELVLSGKEKFKGNYTEENKPKFKPCEDSLTSSVFGLLKFLPHEMFSSIINNSIINPQAQINLEGIDKIDFWPKWSSKNTSNEKNTDNKNYVEPEVFISAKESDIVVEAKLDTNIQRPLVQWKDQIVAYQNEYYETNSQKILIFLAVGGFNIYNEPPDVNSFEFFKKQNYYICRITWDKILQAVVSERKNITLDSTNSGILEILNSIENLFNYHGIFDITWLSELDYKSEFEAYQINDNFKMKFYEYRKY